jgi:phosphoribosylformylglycinamidine synthase
MKFFAEINIMPLKEILDPQGKAVTSSMKNLDLQEIQHVRIGKHITLELEAPSETIAKDKVDQACKKLLANPIMESYKFELHLISNAELILSQ